MPITHYPFTRLGPDAPFLPFLYITVINPQNGFSKQMPALIDTGADQCAIPGFYAHSLGHVLRKGDRRDIVTANGNAVAYSHTCQI